MAKSTLGRVIPAPKLSAAPASPTEGEVYYDTVLHQLMIYNGTAWVAVGGGASIDLMQVFAFSTD